MSTIDSSDMSQYSDEIIEENLSGNEAGRAFADRHIIQKINLFIEEYRRNGYTENFISGFLDGVNDQTGALIQLTEDEEESEDGSLTMQE